MLLSKTLAFSKPPSRIGLKPLSIVDELQRTAQAAENKHQKGTRLLSRFRPKKKENIDSVSTDVLATKDIDAAPLRRMVARHPLTIDHTIECTPFAPRKLSALFPQVLLRSRTVNLRRALSNTTAYRSPSAPEIRPVRLFIVLPPRSQIAASAPLTVTPSKTPKPSRITVYVRGPGTGFRHSTSPYAFCGARAPQTRSRAVSETATQADLLVPEISSTFAPVLLDVKVDELVREGMKTIKTVVVVKVDEPGWLSGGCTSQDGGSRYSNPAGGEGGGRSTHDRTAFKHLIFLPAFDLRADSKINGELEGADGRTG